MADDSYNRDDENRLFREQVGPVRPLAQDVVEPVFRRVAPVPRKTLEDRHQVLQDSLSDEFHPADVETGEELLYFRSGLQHRLIRKLRRGQFSLRAELDLHGMTVAMARQALLRFLLQCRERDQRCVRVIHGKGNGSSHRGPILKTMVNRWLQQRDEVLAFCSALPAHGGTGAVYVLLKRR
ncbi:MAG: Smr/MutS family protein [Gammaproteobacteria bacterium]